MKVLKIIFIVSIVCLSRPVYSDISLPYVFSSNMVLQRGIEIPIWGWASPGERIIISIGDQKVRTKAEKSGNWFATLQPIQAGGPYEMTIDGKNEVVFNNVMIGDVWICSGQSNMEWPVSRSNNADEEIQSADYPNIRLFTVPNKINKEPLNNTDSAEWLICTPENIPPFSAVGYFFGRQLHQDLNIPIGLINTTWGGTGAESWTSAERIKDDPDFYEKLQELQSLDVDNYKEELKDTFQMWRQQLITSDEGYENGIYLWASSDMDYSDWQPMELPGQWESAGFPDLNGVVWFMKEINLPEIVVQSNIQLKLGRIDDSDMVWFNGVKVGETINARNANRNYMVESDLLKKGKNVIVVRVEDYRDNGGIYGHPSQLMIEASECKMTLSGTWLYKIGSDKMPEDPPPPFNFGPNSFPTLLFNAMINPLVPYGMKGTIWYQGEHNAGRAYQYRRIFPQLIRDWRLHWGQGDFPFIFVQLANFMQPKDPPEESEWAELREAQTMTLSLPNTGMATIIDIGEADDIHPRNKQDVGKRLALSAYKVAYGKDVVYTGPTYESMVIEGDKVFVNFDNTGSGLTIKDPYGYIKGFTLAGEDKVFHWARADRIDDNTVVLYSEHVSTPVAVRYGWADNPHDANLYNKEGLPANPFRTDNWEGITSGKK